MLSDGVKESPGSAEPIAGFSSGSFACVSSVIKEVGVVTQKAPTASYHRDNSQPSSWGYPVLWREVCLQSKSQAAPAPSPSLGIC